MKDYTQAKLQQISIALILVFTFSFVLFTVETSAKDNRSDESVRELLEDLYLEYEAVEERLIELKEGLTELPSNEQGPLTPFTVTIKKKKNDFYLNFVEIKENGSPLWSHIYTPVENKAMENGGRHQFFKGTISKGKRRLTIKYQYSYRADKTPYKETLNWKVGVDNEPVFVEILFTKEGSDLMAKPKELYIVDKSTYEEDE